MFGSVIVSPRSTLSPQQALELANVYLNAAYNAKDPIIALVLCHDTEMSLFQAKKAAKHDKNQTTMNEIATAYIDLGKLLERYNRDTEAKAFCKKGEKLGIVQSLKGSSPSSGAFQAPGLMKSLFQGKQTQQPNFSIVPAYIFAQNVLPPVIKLPEAYGRLNSTQQLAVCLDLLQVLRPRDDTLNPEAQEWLEAIEKDTDEVDRLKTMATEVILAFKRDKLKDAKAVAEIVYLAPVLDKNAFHDLLSEFYSGIDHSGLLQLHLLEGLAQLIQGADSDYLSADDLVKILRLLSTRLQDTHDQSSDQLYQLTLAVSRVLDAMADTNVTGLDRESLHGPLSEYLGELKKSSDPYLVYQAAYAFQALLCIPDNETMWQGVGRRTFKVIQGVSGLASAVKGVDLDKFVEGLQNIQQGLAGVSRVAGLISTAYNDVVSLAYGGENFLISLKEGFSFEKKRDWYTALRGADALIQAGEFATFRELVCKAPCRLDPAFQWGLCQRLGEIAVNPLLEANTRKDAIAFLGEIYRNDAAWGQHVSVKQWTLNIVIQLSSISGTSLQSE
ncbi:hypothetical protein BGX34_004123 [Mortierella sp. NVP85]|nr:hypothetical protein BGX34_004123 [Mortierella sp. NVP85]